MLHNARYMYYTHCSIVCAAHMRAVLLSVVLGAELCAAQLLQPLQIARVCFVFSLNLP